MRSARERETATAASAAPVAVALAAAAALLLGGAAFGASRAACARACHGSYVAAVKAAKASRATCRHAATGVAARRECLKTYRAALRAAQSARRAGMSACRAADGEATCGTTTTTLPGPACPSRGDGVPSQLSLTLVGEGSDVDLGWTGAAHNFALTGGAQFDLCLADCDATTTSQCHVTGATGAATPAAPAPIPALVVGTPVCIVSEWATTGEHRSAGTFDLQTGAADVTLRLLYRLYARVGSAALICPRCQASSNTIGATGHCTGSVRDGQPCTVQGVATVIGATPSTYPVSNDCLPEGIPDANLPITIPLTTALATSDAGPLPCAGQSAPDSCGGGSTCSVDCSARPDVHGGRNQTCCSDANGTPCFPTRDGGPITRSGSPLVPSPAWPEPTYPKTTFLPATFAATVCLPVTGGATTDLLAGFPGPIAVMWPLRIDVRAGS